MAFKNTVAVTSILVAALVYARPQILPERFSRAVLRFIIYDVVLALFYSVFIYPFFFSPLRHLPGPTVSAPLRFILLLKLIPNRATTPSGAMAQHNSPNLPENR